MFKSLYWSADEVFYQLEREGTPAPEANPGYSARANVGIESYWMRDYGQSPEITGVLPGVRGNLYQQVRSGPEGPEGCGYSWEIPSLGLGGSGATASGRTMEIAYLGVRIYAEDTGVWSTHVEGVRVTVDGAVVFSGGGTREIMGIVPRSPCAVPLLGFPPTIAGGGLVNPQTAIPFDPSGPAGHGGHPGPEIGVSEGAALGRWGWREGGSEHLHPIAVSGDGVSASGGHTGRVEFRHRQGSTVVESDLGDLTLMPSPPKGLVRVETPYQALVERYGFPRGRKDRSDYTAVVDPSSGPVPDNPVSSTFPLEVKGHILSRAGDVPVGDLETPISATVLSPYRYTRDRLDIGFAATTTTNSVESFPENLRQFRGGGISDAEQPNSGPNGIVPYLRHRWVPLITFYNTWGNPGWSYGLPTLEWEDLPNAYWWNVRQQKVSSPALPAIDDTDERTQIVTEGLDQAGAFPLDQYNTLGLASAWGLAGFKARTLEAASRTYDANSAAAWSIRIPEGEEEPNASIEFTVAGVRVSDWEDESATLVLDLGRWDAPPAMLWRAAKDLTLTKPIVNLKAIRVFLEGIDGERFEVLPQGNVYTVKPVRANARRPTGTYTGDFGAGEFEDKGLPLTPFVLGPPTKGDVAFRLDIDPEASLSLLTPAVGAWARLAIELAPTNPALPITLAWPTIHGADLSKARVRREGGRYASILLEDGPPLRFSQLFWDENFDVLLDTPGVPDPIAAPTVGDGLFWEQTVLRGLPATTDAYARVDELYEAGIEFTIAKHAFRKVDEDGNFYLVNHSFLCGGDGGRPVLVFADAFQAAPLASFPRRRRTKEADWREVGVYGAWSYAIASPVRSVIAPDHPGRPPGVSVVPPASYVTLSDQPDGELPSGWLGRSVRVAISTTAGAQDLDRYLDLGRAHMARVGLRRGFLLAYGEIRPTRAFRGGVHNLATHDGRFAIGFADPDDGARVRTWDAAVPSGSADASVIVATGEGYVSARVCQDVSLTMSVNLSRVDGGTVSATVRRSNDSGRTWSDPEPLMIPDCLYPLTVSGHGPELVTIGFVPDDPDDPESPGVLKGYFRATPNAAPGPVRTLATSTGTVRVENRAFGHHPAREGAGRWILSAVPEGATSETSWGSTDVGDPDGFTFIPL